MYCDVVSVFFDYSTLLAVLLSSVTHSIPHSRAPGNLGNENGRSRIPGNEKPRPGMKTLIPLSISFALISWSLYLGRGNMLWFTSYRLLTGASSTASTSRFILFTQWMAFYWRVAAYINACVVLDPGIMLVNFPSLSVCRLAISLSVSCQAALCRLLNLCRVSLKSRNVLCCV